MTIPRVTEVLRPFSNYENVPKDFLERAAARGTSVHAICAGLAKGNWIPDSMIAEELQGYVKSFKLWSEAQVTKFIIIEKRYTNELAKFSGQVDFVVLGTDGEKYLVDLKTGAKPQKTHPLQMAAYEMLLEYHEMEVKAALLVYLDKDGEFPNIHYLEGMMEPRHIFLSALDCWHYFNKGKKNGRRQEDTD